MDRGEGPHGNFTNNALTAKLLLVIPKAEWHHVTQYMCTIKYSTSDAPAAAQVKENNFTETPVVESKYLSPFRYSENLGLFDNLNNVLDIFIYIYIILCLQ